MGDPLNIEGIFVEMNRDMPVNRRTLAEIIDSGDITYNTRSGIKGSMSKEAIDLLAEICTPEEYLRLRLPLMVSTDPMSERGGWKVEGRVEAAVVARILKKNLRRDDLIQIYYPDLVELKHALPDTTVVLFTP